MPISYLTAAVAILVIGLSWAGSERSERSEAQLQHDRYCEMIEIHKQSGGEYGWPDDGRDCNE